VVVVVLVELEVLAVLVVLVGQVGHSDLLPLEVPLPQLVPYILVLLVVQLGLDILGVQVRPVEHMEVAAPALHKVSRTQRNQLEVPNTHIFSFRHDCVI